MTQFLVRPPHCIGSSEKGRAVTRALVPCTSFRHSVEIVWIHLIPVSIYFCCIWQKTPNNWPLKRRQFVYCSCKIYLILSNPWLFGTSRVIRKTGSYISILPSLMLGFHLHISFGSRMAAGAPPLTSIFQTGGGAESRRAVTCLPTALAPFKQAACRSATCYFHLHPCFLKTLYLEQISASLSHLPNHSTKAKSHCRFFLTPWHQDAPGATWCVVSLPATKNKPKFFISSVPGWQYKYTNIDNASTHTFYLWLQVKLAVSSTRMQVPWEQSLCFAPCCISRPSWHTAASP